MTNDITHDLSLLADEAEPAPIDSHAVVANARARTRNRRAMATAFASVATIGALTMTLTTDRSTDAATDGESASARLTAQYAAALPDLIPARWVAATTPLNPPTSQTPPTVTEPPPNTFRCESDPPAPGYPPAQDRQLPDPLDYWPSHGPVHSPLVDDVDQCGATGWYEDAEGRFDLLVQINNGGNWFFNPCVAPECEEWGLPDGTRVRMNVSTVGVSAYSGLQQASALRPDGTYIHVYLLWQNVRSTPPMTLDELVKFADKFDY